MTEEQSVAKWERGDSLPDLRKCMALAEVYNVSLDALVSRPARRVLEEQDGAGRHLFAMVQVDDQGRITLPQKAREVFQIESGDELLVLGDERKGIAIVKINGTTGFFRQNE